VKILLHHCEVCRNASIAMSGISRSGEEIVLVSGLSGRDSRLNRGWTSGLRTDVITMIGLVEISTVAAGENPRFRVTIGQ
jgi:hypothetical protein